VKVELVQSLNCLKNYIHIHWLQDLTIFENSGKIEMLDNPIVTVHVVNATVLSHSETMNCFVFEVAIYIVNKCPYS